MAFLTSALDGDEWSASRHGSFTPGTHWIGGWVAVAVAVAVAKRRISQPLLGIEPRPTSP